MGKENESKPDVEAMLQDIRANMKAAEEAVPAAQRSAVNDEDNLHDQLAAANRSCATGNGLTGWRALFMKPLLPWRHEINTFNGSVVRVLNRMVKLLEGQDLPETGALLDNQKRRLTLMEKMSDRIAELEARVKELEENRKA